MSYFTLTYYAVNAANQYAAGVEKTLADWGVKRCEREAENSAKDSLGIDISATASGPDLFPYGSKVVLQIGRQSVAGANQTQPSKFIGGRVWYVGYRQRHVRSASGRMQGFKYQFANAWTFFMERHTFQKLWPSWNGKAIAGLPTTSVVLGESTTLLTENGVQTTQMTIAQQVVEIVNYTANQTGLEYGAQQFQLDTNFVNGPLSGSGALGGWKGYCPMDAANDITCAEALKKTLKIVPGVSMWFDYSTNPPTLHIATRDTLPSVTLPYGNTGIPVAYGPDSDPVTGVSPYGNYTSEIDRRDDLLPVCVDYKYKVTSTVVFNGLSTTVITLIDDVACAAGYGYGIYNGQATTTGGGIDAGALPQSLAQFTQYIGTETATFDFYGQNALVTTLNTTPIPLNPATNPDDLATWTQVLASSLSNQSITPGSISVPGGVPATLTYKGGATTMNGVPSSVYGYFMTGGPVPKNVQDPANPSVQQGIQMNLSCTFQYTTQTPAADSTAEAPKWLQGETKTSTISVDLACFTLPSGTYTSLESAETIPLGLALYVYNIQNIPQYDGKHGIFERDPQSGMPTVTDPCPLGVNLNLSGNQSEFLSMNAQVQTVSYDLMTGHTDITFGVAGHLGATDFIERLRVNRGPRWFYLIGTPPSGSNTNGNSISGPTQIKDTQAAGGASSFQAFPLSSAAGVPSTPSTVTTGGSGFTIDSRTTGQPGYGGVAPVPGAPTTALIGAYTAGATPYAPSVVTSAGALPAMTISDGVASQGVGHSLSLSAIPEVKLADTDGNTLTIGLNLANFHGQTANPQIVLTYSAGTATLTSQSLTISDGSGSAASLAPAAMSVTDANGNAINATCSSLPGGVVMSPQQITRCIGGVSYTQWFLCSAPTPA